MQGMDLCFTEYVTQSIFKLREEIRWYVQSVEVIMFLFNRYKQEALG